MPRPRLSSPVVAPSKLSKREMRDLRRLRREEAQLRARRKRFWLNMGVIGGAIVVAIIVLGLVALSIHERGGSAKPKPSTSASTSGSPAPTTSGSATSPAATASGGATSPATVATSPAPTPKASGSPAR